MKTYCNALFSVVDETLDLNIESNSSDDDVIMNWSYVYKMSNNNDLRHLVILGTY